MTTLCLKIHKWRAQVCCMAVVGLKTAALYLFSKTLAFNHFGRLIQFPRLMTEAGHRKTDKNCGWEISKNQDSFKNPAKKTFSRNLSNEKSLRRRFRKKRKLPTWWKKEESSSWNRPKFLFKKVQIYFKDNRLLCRSLLLFTIAMTAIKDQIKFFISWRYKFCFLCFQKLVVGVWWVSEPTSIFCPKLLSLLLLLLSSLKFNQNLEGRNLCLDQNFFPQSMPQVQFQKLEAGAI